MYVSHIIFIQIQMEYHTVVYASHMISQQNQIVYMSLNLYSINQEVEQLHDVSSVDLLYHRRLNLMRRKETNSYMHNSKPCTYCRGQVWMRKNYTNVNKNSSIQEGSRPVLIISSDDGNATSPLVTTIPITSENKPDILINVRIYNESGERNTVLCNQICLTNKEDLISYQYTVPHKDMIRIDKGIMLSLGLNNYIGNWDMVRSFDRLTDTLKVIVKDRVDEMLNKKHDQLSVGDINKYVDKLLSERDDSSNTETDLAAEEDHEEGGGNYICST